MTKIYPILLAGGKGTRLWPISTVECPKQFSKIFNGLSLFQITVSRLKNEKFYNPVIVTNQYYVKYIQEQLKGVKYSIIVEPEGKDTGPAITLAISEIDKHDPNSTILIVPSDHYILNPDNLFESIQKGTKFVNQKIIIFGIKPDKPETGYGYIKKGKNIGDTCYDVDQFKEKPNLELAIQYINDKSYSWNSGIYLFKTNIMREEIKLYCQDMYFKIANNKFSEIEPISIDYAVTEKSRKVIVVDTDILWSDVGTWKGLWDVSDKDKNNNVILDDNKPLIHKSNNCLIQSIKNVVLVRVENICVVETETEILVLGMDYSQDIKEVSKEYNLRD